MPSRNSNKLKKGKSTVAKRVTVKSTILQPASVAPNKSKPKSNAPSLKLSPCAWKFTKTVFDPFNSPAGACVPSLPNMPSRKFKTIVRGTVVNGASTGYIAVNPFAGCTFDLAVARITGSTFAGTSMTLDSAAPTGVSNIFTNSQYAQTNFGPTLGLARLVACGIRIKYQGTVMNRSGVVYAIQNRAHQSLDGYSTAVIGTLPNALITTTPDNEWVNVIYTPNDPTDYDWYNPSSRGSSTSLNQNGLIAIMFDGNGTAGNGSFIFEVHGHYETNIRTEQSMTPSESDPVGLAVTANIISNSTVDGYTGILDTGRLWNNLSALASHDLTRFAVGSAMNLGMRYLTHASRDYRGGPVIQEM